MAAPTLPSGTPAQKLGKVRLPRTTSRLSAGHTFCRVVTTVRRAGGHIWIDGPIHPPGAEVAANDCNIVIECAGPVTRSRGHSRPEFLWILWHWHRDGWRECSRALAIGAEWVLSLGPMAEDLLRQPIGLYDVRSRSAQLATEAIAALDERIAREPNDVRRQMWLTLYDQLPARIVAD